jgi:hypothetical protein
MYREEITPIKGIGEIGSIRIGIGVILYTVEIL